MGALFLLIMWYIIFMYSRLLTAIMLFFCVVPASCATVNVNAKIGTKIHKYHEINGLFYPYVEQWMDLAKDHGLSFKHTVNIGFTNIEDKAVGLTRFEDGFREIDVDSTYWNFSTESQKTVLIWHELTHAHCDRLHDYGKNKPYGDDVDLAMKKQKAGGPGFYEDHCPKSLMFPSIIPEYCFKLYYFRYIDDMFENCKPY